MYMRLIQKYLPNPRHTEVYRIFVQANPETAWNTVRHLDMGKVPLVRLLFDIRALPDRLKGQLKEEDRRIGVDQITDKGTEVITRLSKLMILYIDDNQITKADTIRLLVTRLKKLVYLHFDNYKRTGSLFFSTHRSEKIFMQDEFEARKNAGFDVSFLDASELKNLYGLKAAFAILSKQGCTTDAYILTHALLQHSIKKGLQVFDKTRVTTINYSTVTLQTENGFTIKAKYIVNATGYEVVNFLTKDIVDFYCTYAMASEQEESSTSYWNDDVMLWNTDDPYLYMRITEDKRILIGGRDERFSNAFTRQVLLEKKSRQLEKDLRKVLPGISFKKEFVWSGTFGKTKDSLPYIGPYNKTPNAYYALGFGGNGITFSLIAARIIADLLKGRTNRDSNLFSFYR